VPVEQFATTSGARAAPRPFAAAARLRSGAIAIAGWGDLVERYDPTSDSFSTMAHLPRGLSNAAIATLSGDRVLVAGGGSAGTPAADAMLVVGSEVVPTSGSLDLPRFGHRLSELPDGTVLATGGTAEGDGEVFVAP
jgi:hypothetical protein